ncbi:MAG: hypothetical protein ACOCYT_00120 [Chloroflexota bacterium]
MRRADFDRKTIIGLVRAAVDAALLPEERKAALWAAVDATFRSLLGDD